MKEKEINYQLMVELNGSDYNPKDNRTHRGPILASSPSRDLEHHMAFNKENKGTVLIRTKIGSFMGIHNVEISKAAINKVFHFPKASDFSNKSVKFKDLLINTLYPSSMMARYNMTSNVSYTQKVPVFIDLKTALFFIVMDERFLEDKTVVELGANKIENVKILSGIKNKKYLAITGSSLEELEKNLNSVDGAYDTLRKNYKSLFLSLLNSKRVIVLRYDTKNENDKDMNLSSSQVTIPNFGSSKDVFELMMRQKMQLEIFQAAQIDSLFYLMDEDGKINPKAIVCYDAFTTDVENRKKETSSLSDYHSYNGGMTYLVIDYTEEDWNFIKSLRNRLEDVFKDLETFFLSTKTNLGLPDKSFIDVEMIGYNKQLFLGQKK